MNKKKNNIFIVIAIVLLSFFLYSCSNKSDGAKNRMDMKKKSAENEKLANKIVKEAGIYHKKQEYEKAIKLYKQAIDLMPESSMFASYNLIVGDILFEMQKYDEAIKAYQDLVKSLPNHSQGWTQLGACYLFLKNYKKAAELLDKSIAMDSNDYLQFYYGGLAHSQLGNVRKAKEYLTKALEMYPELEKLQPDLKQYLETDHTVEKK